MPGRQRFFGRPVTRMGWWSVGLGVTFLLFWNINSTVFMPATVVAPWRQVILPFYGIFMLLCGLAAGVLGLIAVIRGERSWLVWLTILPGLFVVFFILGEVLVPH